MPVVRHRWIPLVSSSFVKLQFYLAWPLSYKSSGTFLLEAAIAHWYIFASSPVLRVLV